MKPSESEIICARVLLDEAKRVRAHAKKLGLPTSVFIRQVVVEAIAKPTNRRRAAA